MRRSLEKKIKPPETKIILLDKKNKMLCIDVLKLRKDGYPEERRM